MPSELHAAAVSANASAELSRLESEERQIKDRMQNDGARLAVIAASKKPLVDLIAQATPAPTPAPSTSTK